LPIHCQQILLAMGANFNILLVLLYRILCLTAGVRRCRIVLERSRSYALAACFAIVLAGRCGAVSTERFSIVQNGATVGRLSATTEGDTVNVDYAVDENGRGPKHHETIRLNSDFIPVEWSVSGTSLMGGPVSERYVWKSGKATWKSQADSGEISEATPPLYIVDDDSPWALEVYARALLKAPSHTLRVLPSGAIRLTPVRDANVGQGDNAVPVTIYRIDGVKLDPDYVMLDHSLNLFSTLGVGSLTVRQGYEKDASAISEIARQLGFDLARDRQRRLTHHFDAPMRIRNVRIFDPRSGALSSPSTVVVTRGHVAEILPVSDRDAEPKNEVLVDGEGGTLVPGLHDMHSHTSLESGLFYLAAGVTSTRDMGNDNNFLLALIPQIDSGEIPGPRITANGFLEGRSPYSAHTGFIPDSLPEALRDVQWYADRGYFQIKIYNSMNPDWVKPIADEAHKLGMTVTGHIPAFDTPDRAIQDGYNEITHINQLMLGWLLKRGEDSRTPLRLTAMARAADLNLSSPEVEHTLALMRANHIAHDPTAVIVERLMLSRAGTIQPGDLAYLDHMPIGYQRYRKRTFIPLHDAAEDERYRKAFTKVIDTLRMLHENGIRLLPGTDDGTGFTLHREIELYTLAGMTPAEALNAATLLPEEYFGRSSDLGTIERGKVADFFLIAGDPTKNIRAINSARMVSKGTSIYFPSEIYEELSIKPFAAPPLIRMPALGDNLSSNPK
jgi:imidazolonepropionase-like amidohydrolase